MIPMKYFNYSIVLLITCLITINAQAAGIKKWTDENGRVYYGDTPPQSVQAQTITTTKRPTKLGKPLPRLDITNKSNSNTSKSLPKSPDSLEPEQAKEACDIAKKDMAVITNSSRIQLRAADGSLRYLTKDEIKQRLDRSKSDIKKFCQ